MTYNRKTACRARADTAGCFYHLKLVLNFILNSPVKFIDALT